MTNAMAKATNELLRDGMLHLLPGHNLPEIIRQDVIDLNEDDPVALCAKLNTEFSAELDTTNAPELTAAGFWHAWGMPCHHPDTGEVTGVKVRYQ